MSDHHMLYDLPNLKGLMASLLVGLPSVSYYSMLQFTPAF